MKTHAIVAFCLAIGVLRISWNRTQPISICHPDESFLTPTRTDGECRKFLLLSTQRSGSSWACELFDEIEGISCGSGEVSGFVGGREPVPVSELLIKYSYVKPNESEKIMWTEYENDLMRAFAKVRKRQGSCVSHHGAFGFKLMYDQIPKKFVRGGFFPRFLATRNISVVHLVREASVLTLASLSNNLEQIGNLQTQHAVNAKLVDKFRKAKPIEWNENTIMRIFQLERYHLMWERELRLNLVQYQYLSYEDLLPLAMRHSKLNIIKCFLLQHQKSKDNLPKVNGTLLQLHEPTCRGRVLDYEVLRGRINNTRTALACDMIETLVTKRVIQN